MRTLLISLLTIALTACLTNHEAAVVVGESRMTLDASIAYCEEMDGELYYEFSYERGREALSNGDCGWTAGHTYDESGNVTGNVVLCDRASARGEDADYLAFPLCRIVLR